MTPPSCQPVVSLRPWRPQAAWDARGSPCYLTWSNHGETPLPALGTRMDTGHPRLIESEGLVCRCGAGRGGGGQPQTEGQRDSTCLIQAAFTFHQDSWRSFQDHLLVFTLGHCPAASVYSPRRARMTLKNIDLSSTCFPSSTAAHDSEHRCSKAPCSLACWSLWSPLGQSWSPGSLHHQGQD